ncbi:MAG: NADH-quinone oxidoreductase subunit A [Acidobacteriota bacterium]
MATYIPIALFSLAAILLVTVTMLAGRLIRPASRDIGSKLDPYECGVEPVRDARQRFSVRFYIVAMLFLVFDVETVFLFPWAVQYRQLALFGLVEMVIFLAILVLGYVYAWKRGALEWV